MSACSLVVLLSMVGPAPVRPATEPAPPADRVGVLRTLVVADHETVRNALCLGCPVVVRGQVNGDTVAILGGVQVKGGSGQGSAQRLWAVGGSVRLAGQAHVPASMLAIGGPVTIDPGAEASYEVDALPWLHVPGQREVRPAAALALLAFTLATTTAGALAGGAVGIARVQQALRSRTAACTLVGAAVLAAFLSSLANGPALGRFEAVAQAAAGLVLWASVAVGTAGVAEAGGRRLARALGAAAPRAWKSVVLGGTALGFLILVPVLGALLALATLLLASGAACVGGAARSR